MPPPTHEASTGLGVNDVRQPGSTGARPGQALRREARAGRRRPRRAHGHGHGRARPERRRQDHGGAHPDHAHRGRRRARRSWPASTCAPTAPRCAAASASPPRTPRSITLLTGRENLDHARRAAPALAASEAAARAGELLEQFSLTDAGRPGDLGLLGRHAPPARPRRHPRRPTRRCCSSTSPPPASTRAPASSCGTSSTSSSPRAPRSCSPPSTSTRPTGSPTTSWSSTTGRIIAHGDARQLKREVGGDHLARRRRATPRDLADRRRPARPGQRRARPRRRAGPVGQRAHQRRRRRRRRRSPGRWPTPASPSTTSACASPRLDEVFLTLTALRRLERGVGDLTDGACIGMTTTILDPTTGRARRGGPRPPRPRGAARHLGDRPARPRRTCAASPRR